MGKITHKDAADMTTAHRVSESEWKANTTHLDSQGNSLEISRSATLVVAASDASANSKAGADYVCDGTADDVQIQAAIDALTTGRTWKETVCLIGEFNIASVVNLASYTVLDLRQATLNLAASTYLYISNKTNADIFGGKLDGGSLTGNTGIASDGSSQFITIDGTDIRNMGERGILFNISGTSTMAQIRVRNVYISNVGRAGIQFHSSATSGGCDELWLENFSVDTVNVVSTSAFGVWFSEAGWDDCIKHISHGNVKTLAFTTSGDGFALRGNKGFLTNNKSSGGLTGDGFAFGNTGLELFDWVVSGNESLDNAGKGFMLYRVKRSNISNNYASGNAGEGFHCRGCQNNQIIGNHAQANTVYGGLSLRDDLEGVPAGSLRNTIIGNQLNDNTGTGILEEGLADYNIILGNHVTGNSVAQITKTGTNSIVARNIGYATENSGTATVASGQTTIVVSHGLATTPTRVYVSPTNSMGLATNFWVDTLTTTQFTINVNTDPGATTGIFNWRAVIGEGN